MALSRKMTIKRVCGFSMKVSLRPCPRGFSEVVGGGAPVQAFFLCCLSTSSPDPWGLGPGTHRLVGCVNEWTVVLCPWATEGDSSGLSLSASPTASQDWILSKTLSSFLAGLAQPSG